MNIGYRRVFLVLLLAYPVASHTAMYFHCPALALAALFAVALAAALSLLPGHRLWVLLAGLLGGILLWRLPAASALIYLPPLLLNTGLGLLFGRTLVGGRVPLITRFAEEVMGDRHPERRGYTRGVTLAWTLAFAAMALESLLLALFASAETWSLFTNVLNYLFIAALFLGEFIVRLVRFREPFSPFLFFRRLARVNWRALASDE